MTPIGDYVYNGDLLKINRYINQGNDINIHSDEFSLLYILVDRNHISCVKEFLRCKANLNIKNLKSGLTPLHIACYNDNLEMIKILLEGGANINEVDNKGNTPLSFLVKYGKDKLIKFLKENGADINKKNNSKNTAIEISIQYGNLECIKVFLELGYEINKVIQGEMSLLGIATINNKKDIIKYLIEKGADINLRDGLGFTPIIYSILSDKVDLLEYYLEGGADINILTNDNHSILYYTIENKNNDFFNILINKNVDLNIISKKGISPLLKACKIKNLYKIEKLLEKGAIIDYNTKYSPLKMVIQNDDYDIFDLFIKYGLDLNLEINGISLLVNAIRKKDIVLVRYLIKNGANVNYIDSKNNIPLKIAITETDYTEIVELILNNGFDFMAYKDMKFDLLLLCLNCNNIKKSQELLNIFLRFRFDINEKNELGQTLLFSMVYRLMFSNKNYKLVKLLLDYGADIEIIDNQGFSLFDIAIQKCSYEVANFLISNHINIERCDKEGNSYLMKFISMPEEPDNKIYVKLFDKLIKNRKLIEKKNRNKDTPIITAARQNNIYCVERLIEEKANINHVNKKGRNALFEAVENMSNILITTLLDAGINFNALDIRGNNVLHLSCILGYSECVNRLLFEGIDPDLLNKKKLSPLDICLLYGNNSCAEIILDLSKKYVYEECRNSGDCIICLESIEKGKEYKVCSICKNLLHLPCLKSWLKTKNENKCMMCSTNKVIFHSLIEN